MKNILKLILISIFSTLIFIGCSLTNNKESNTELTISVAASLKESMLEIKDLFEKDNPNISLNLNFGSSGSLMQQIEQGAPCNLFISAGQSQMDSLEKKGFLQDNTRKNLLKNSLVLISSSDITNINDLCDNKIRHIAIGEPSSVPAGKYADEVLANLNLKNTLSNKLVFAKDVKEVLSWVSTGNAEAGFVYKSDTVNTNSIKIIEEIADDLHSPISYPIAIIKNNSNNEDTLKFYNYLNSEESKNIFNKNGYEIL
ncbi:MAG: molybdate ABC transporter substrate-binding protein [Clostridium sp.]|nr:molybdate ABC transporter substrate-binding protein [Clostridium sp.]